METYKNLSGQSCVARYQIAPDHIIVEFKERNKDGHNTYKYSYQIPGQCEVNHMKQLAVDDRGLNSYISTTVKKRYEDKW